MYYRFQLSNSALWFVRGKGNNLMDANTFPKDFNCLVWLVGPEQWLSWLIIPLQMLGSHTYGGMGPGCSTSHLILLEALDSSKE